jgi:hypothetical protein
MDADVLTDGNSVVGLKALLSVAMAEVAASSVAACSRQLLCS